MAADVGRFDRIRQSLHSAPLPRSLERMASPRLRPNWSKDQKAGGAGGSAGLGPTHHQTYAAASRRQRKELLVEEKGRREKLYHTVNTLSELQLNITNDLIDSVISDRGG